MALIDESEFVGLDGVAQRIRVSPHVHDARDDVERFFEALDRVATRPQPSRRFNPS